MTVPTGTTIWVEAGVTDMRRGFTGINAGVQTVLEENPFGKGAVVGWRWAIQSSELTSLCRWLRFKLM